MQGFVGTLGAVAANDSRSKYPEFARELLAGMARTGVSVKDIVGEIKVDGETVRLWKRGERMPRDAKLHKLAKMIGVDVATLRFGDAAKGDRRTGSASKLKGEHVTDEDELALLEAYRGLKKEWARQALRRRAVELLEEFGERGAKNPWAKSDTGTQ